MRLIDADDLIVMFIDDEEGNAFVFVPKEFIDQAPTIEAEPIRHGKWIDDKVAFYRQCSECGANVRANLYEVFLDCDIRDLHYCPNCGAKMDGVKDE